MEHHELANIIPLMADDEYEKTKADIAANGLLNPILIYEGKVLDGRHRLRACEELKIAPAVEQFEGDREAALRRVISLNLHRRHLNTSQRASIAAGLVTAQQGRQPKGSNDPFTVDQAAELLNVSPKSVKRAKAARKAAPGGPKVSKAFFAKDPDQSKKIAEAVIDKGLTDTQAQEAYGVSSTVVRIAVAHEIGQREARADPIIDPAALSASAQEKLAAALRQHKKALADAFQAEVEKEVKRVVEGVWLPHHEKLVADAKRLTAARRGIMTKKQHQLIRMCLHPDNAAGVEKRAEAFRVFEAIPTVLLFDEAEEARIARITPLPSLGEILQRRNQREARR